MNNVEGNLAGVCGCVCAGNGAETRDDMGSAQGVAELDRTHVVPALLPREGRWHTRQRHR